MKFILDWLRLRLRAKPQEITPVMRESLRRAHMNLRFMQDKH